MTDTELMQLSERIGQALKARGATLTTRNPAQVAGLQRSSLTLPAVPPGLNVGLLPTVMKQKRK